MGHWASVIQTIWFHHLRIPQQASVFVQTCAFVTDNRKDTSLLQNLSSFVNYDSVNIYSKGPGSTS